MGLVGRLEDLPITDILQIVHLSRGTGILELKVAGNRHTMMFNKGLMVNAWSPAVPSLRLELKNRPDVRSADLEKIIFERVSTVLRNLAEARSGQFEFIARQPTIDEIEYDPQAVFSGGGVRPDAVLGKSPNGLYTLAAVKQNLGAVKQRDTLPQAPRTVTAPIAVPQPAALPDDGGRCLLLLEENAANREAIKREAAKRGIATVDVAEADAGKHIRALLDRNQFFVAVLSLGAGQSESIVFSIIAKIKHRNPNVPIVVIDGTSDFRRRHLSLEAGADLYMRKPAPSADEERLLFADDLLLYVKRRFAGRPAAPAAESAAAPVQRGFRLLVELIKEMSNPGDINQMSLMILQLAADSLDRAVLFALRDQKLVPLGKFGIRNNPAAFPLRRGDLSILDDVVSSGNPFHGAVDDAAASQLESVFGGPRVREAMVLPVLGDLGVVGVFYGDNATNGAPVHDSVGLEAFLAQAGFAFQHVLTAQSRSGSFGAVQPVQDQP